MKELHIDIETYSSADLARCGVYKYTESPDFEILLFGYSCDGGEVRVVDLACGEKLPKEIREALEDESVTKLAHNASFERVCLSRYLGYPTGEYLNPEEWKCTMVWSAYMGLPLSLAGVGAVLGLDKQKMGEGKDLIRYFCVPCAPTKSNGGRTRNLPSDAPDKWDVFKKYNVRDVEVEMQIQQKLERFPVPDPVWEEYAIDQEINDRGVRIDGVLVQNAIAMDTEIKEELKTKMQELTALENPNSVSQLSGWLADNGVETDSLGKKQVKALMEEVPEEIREVLRLRQQLAKSSVKKYQAMKNAACSDGRARGMFMFYGANRTGRFCLTGDHEVLTDEGWKRLDEWRGGRIACWNAASEAVSFQNAEQVCFQYEGKMYTYQDARIDQCSTPDHKMRVQRRFGGAWEDMTVEEMAKCRPVIPFAGYRHRRDCADPNWLRVLIMTQADGFYTSDGSVRYNFKKKRKIERCKTLLRRAEIPFLVYEHKDGVTNISVPARAVPLWLREFRSKTFGLWMLDENAEIIFDELPNWDGYFPAPNSIQYTTTNRQNADIIQALAHMSGRCCSMKIKNRKDRPKWQDAYVLNIWLVPGNRHEIRSKPTITDYQGNVYCAVTQTGYFLVRRNGKVWVTGNSGRLIQMQNLPQNHLPDLAEARALVRQGNLEAVKMLYEDVPDTLSQLIRTAFIPREGARFYVADFSAIEARVLSWIAGEEWRMEVFASGGDIYCATASRMFGVPVVKHGENGELRQKGKQAELSCIAEGSLVLTDRGLVPIEKVSQTDRVWDGEEWVSHDGVVYRGEREVITYEGLTATPDHFVWIEGESEPVQLGFAATCGAHLVQTGDGGRAVRLGENYQSGEEMERKAEPLLRPDAVYGLRCDTVADKNEFDQWEVERMPELHSETPYSKLAGKETGSSQTEMRESTRRRVCQLRCERDKVRVSQCYRSRTLSDQAVRTSGTEDGIGSDRQQRQLCSWEHSAGNKTGEFCESKNNSTQQIRAEVLAVLPECCCPEIEQRDEQGRDYSGCADCSIREKKELANHKRTARLYDIRNAGRHHRFTVSGHLVHNCGYGGSVGALKAMGALELGMKEEELKPLVDSWRSANPNIVRLWGEIERTAIHVIKTKEPQQVKCLRFTYQSGFLFIQLPSGRKLAYVKPRLGENQFGGTSITYEGVGGTKKWERLESFGGKLTENVIQAISRDILCYAMRTLRCCSIVMHVHDELIIEADPRVSLEAICEQMGRTPPWTPGLVLRADGFTSEFYMKD